MWNLPGRLENSVTGEFVVLNFIDMKTSIEITQ